MARAVAEDSAALLPLCSWVDGQYVISGVYLAVEADLGATGVRQVEERELTATELAALRAAGRMVSGLGRQRFRIRPPRAPRRQNRVPAVSA